MHLGVVFRMRKNAKKYIDCFRFSPRPVFSRLQLPSLASFIHSILLSGCQVSLSSFSFYSSTLSLLYLSIFTFVLSVVSRSVNFSVHFFPYKAFLSPITLLISSLLCILIYACHTYTLSSYIFHFISGSVPVTPIFSPSYSLPSTFYIHF